MLRRAEAFAEEDPRGTARAERWRRVMAGVLGDTLAVGSRTPIQGVPAWLTPEIVTGGFATGRLAAEGPLDLQERALAKRLGVEPSVLALNLAYCTRAGAAELVEAAERRALRASFPEATALAAVARLRALGRGEEADALRDRLAPFFERVRFFPRFGPARDRRDAVHLDDVAEFANAVSTLREGRQVAAMRETLRIWRPLAERFVAHALAAPALADRQLGAQRAHERAELCTQPRTKPHAAWHAGLVPLLADIARARQIAWRTTRHLRPSENLGALLRLFERAHAASPTAPDHGLGEGGVARMHAVATRWCAKHGAPGSDERARRAHAEARAAALPSHDDAASLLLARLGALDPTDGLRQPEQLLAEPTRDELAQFVRGAPILHVPPRIRHALERTRVAPVEDLVARRIVVSLEQLAEVVPAMTAAVVGARGADAAAEALLEETYAAFRRRRTLLLRDLQSQVRFDELPWVAGLRATSDAEPAAATAAGEVSARLGAIALEHFPATPLPNPLVSELSMLAHEAGDARPWTEALAADIFMGRFAPKFAEAFLLAAGRLVDTPYDHAYGLELAASATSLVDLDAEHRALRFGELCRSLASRGASNGGGVAFDGRVIEASEVLTSHGVARLFGDLGSGPFVEAARRAFDGVLTTPVEPLPAGTRFAPQSRRYAARALRQALALVSLAPRESALHEVRRWRERVHAVPPPARQAFEEIAEALDAACSGVPHDGAPFLGWLA